MSKKPHKGKTTERGEEWEEKDGAARLVALWLGWRATRARQASEKVKIHSNILFFFSGAAFLLLSFRTRRISRFLISFLCQKYGTQVKFYSLIGTETKKKQTNLWSQSFYFLPHGKNHEAALRLHSLNATSYSGLPLSGGYRQQARKRQNTTVNNTNMSPEQHNGAWKGRKVSKDNKNHLFMILSALYPTMLSFLYPVHKQTIHTQFTLTISS